MNIERLKERLLGGSQRTATVKKNILGSLLIKGISIATSFLLVPLTLGYVSTEIYGVWLTISSILHWLTYMDVGFTHGLKNKLAEALAKEDYERGRSLVSTTYFMMTVIFVPLSIITVFASPFVDWCGVLNVDETNQETVLKTVQLLFVFIALQMIVNVFVAVVAAHQKTALSNLFNVIGQVCSLIIIGSMTLFVKPSLTNLAFAYSLMPIIIVFAASLIYFRTSMKSVAPTLTSINIDYIKDLWGLGIKFFIIQAQMIVLYQSTNILISHVAGPESVTQYNIAYKLLNTVVMIYAIILTPLWPAFTDAYTKQDYTWMNNMYHKMVRIFSLMCIMAISLVVLSPLIYHIWIGKRVEIPFILTIAVAIYTIIHCWVSLQVTLINGTGKVKLQTYVTFIGLILHIPLSIFLAQFIDIYGIIASMAVIDTIYACFFTTQINKITSQKACGIWNK